MKTSKNHLLQNMSNKLLKSLNLRLKLGIKKLNLDKSLMNGLISLKNT